MNELAPDIATADELLNRIRIERSRMPKRLRAVADGIIATPDEIAVLSITEAAERLDASASALVRFAKALGFSGFSPMQKLLLRGLVDGATGSSYHDRIRQIGAGARTDLDYIFDAFTSANIRAMEVAREELDLTALSRFIAALKSARLIGVAGQKRAFPLASYLFYGLARLEADCTLIDGTGGMVPQQGRILGKGDALIVITFAPYAPEMLDLAAAARSRGATVLAITDRPDSPVTQHADASLIVAEANLHDIRSISVTSTIIQTLFVSIGLDVDLAGEGTR